MDEPKRVGSYEVIWDGRDDKGKEVGKRNLFLSIEGGEFYGNEKDVTFAVASPLDQMSSTAPNPQFSIYRSPA